MRFVFTLVMSLVLIGCSTTEALITTASVLASFPELIHNKKSEQEKSKQNIPVENPPTIVQETTDLPPTQVKVFVNGQEIKHIDDLPEQENPFLTPTEPSVPITAVPKPKVVQPSPVVSKPKNNQVVSNPSKPKNTASQNKHQTTPSQPPKCGSFPRTCSAMTSCQQAKQALKCGIKSLDRDGDGLPCESLCGG